MKKLILLFIIVVNSSLLWSATTHYVCADAAGTCNAADSNAGTLKTAAWKHPPDSPNFTGTYTSAVGDQIILRGGDTYHISVATNDASNTPLGGGWTFSHSGSNGNPIYIGVDLTWFNAATCGASWCRPIFTGDNALTTTIPGSCAHDDSAISFIKINGQSFVTVDNFEFTGKCWAGNISTGQVAYYFQSGPTASTSTHNTISNSYFHGWSMTSAAFDAHAAIGGVNNASTTNSTIVGNVIDGSDSTGASGGAECSGSVNGTGNPCQSGWALMGDCYDVHQNVIRYVSNFECANITIVHDNLIEHSSAPVNGGTLGGPHPNVMETIFGYSGLTLIMYNNLIRHNASNVTLWPQFDTGYFFNNVMYDNAIVQSGNCIIISPTGSSAGNKSATINFYNNTIDFPCLFNFYPGNASTPTCNLCTANWENGHFIGSGQSSITGIVSCTGGSVCTQNDNGGELFQSEATANGQGYVTGNNYAPTLSNNSTVHNGINASASCSTFSADSALCSGTSGSVIEASGSGGQIATYPAITINSRGTTFDIGSYQFSSGGGGQVATPTFNPVAGTYVGTQTVTITTSTGGATICYTTDNSTPTANGAGTCTHGTTLSNGGSVLVAVTETLNAIGSLSGNTDSAVGTAAYTITAGPASSVLLTGGTTINFGTVIH
jgi:hypothetical protein